MIIIDMGACPTKTPKQTTSNSPILKSKIFHMLTKKWRGGGVATALKLNFLYIYLYRYMENGLLQKKWEDGCYNLL